MYTVSALKICQHYKGRAVIDPGAYYKSDDAPIGPCWIAGDNDVEFKSNSYWSDDPVGSKKRGRFASYQNIATEKEKKYMLDDGHFFLFSRRLGGLTLKNRRFRK